MWVNAPRDGRLPNIGDTPCSMPWSLADAHPVPCSNAVKTQKALKFTGVRQTHQQLSATSGPKFTILSKHVGGIAFWQVFSDCRYMP